MTDRAADLARQFLDTIPHARALGLCLVEIGAGRAEMELPYDPALVGDPDSGVIAGGAVFTLMDTCSGTAVMCHPDAPGGTATLDLRIDYMRPATPGRAIRAAAQCYHMTQSVAFVRAEAHDGEPGRPVAVATGAFTVERPRAST